MFVQQDFILFYFILGAASRYSTPAVIADTPVVNN